MEMPRQVLKLLSGMSPRLFWMVIIISGLSSILFGKLVYNFHSSVVEKTALRSEELAQSRELTARLDEYQSQKNVGEAMLMEAEKKLIAGGKADAGVAVLQEAFRACSVRNGISIASGRALPTVKQGSYLKIPMEFQFKADVLQLKELLSDMQASPVLMGMRGIRIKSRGTSEPGRLDVSMVVEAAMKPVAAEN